MLYVKRVALDLGRIIVNRPKGALVHRYLEHEYVPGAEEGLKQLFQILGGEGKVFFLKGLRKDDEDWFRMLSVSFAWLRMRIPAVERNHFQFAFRDEKWAACRLHRVNCLVDDRLEVFASFSSSQRILKILFNPDLQEFAENSPEIQRQIIRTDEEIEKYRSHIWKKIILVKEEEGWPRVIEIIKKFLMNNQVNISSYR